MKGGINKIIRNITASAQSKTDFEKVSKSFIANIFVEVVESHIPSRF
jgi:hypothetical protein